MSLINDALRRAKQAQEQAPPGPGLQLRELETTPLRGRGPALLRLGAAGAAGLLALCLLWQELRSHGWPSGAASVCEAHTAAAGAQPARPRATGADLAADAASPLPRPQPPESAGEAGAREATHAPATSLPLLSSPGSATNAPAVAAETAPSGPPPIRLQAIVFHPTRPSAMINGRTLFVGDMVGDMRLVAIGRESATLVGAGQTNLLTLR